jgi:hypothetical protein
MSADKNGLPLNRPVILESRLDGHSATWGVRKAEIDFDRYRELTVDCWPRFKAGVRQLNRDASLSKGSWKTNFPDANRGNQT